MPAVVPGTVAGALRAAAHPVPDDLEERDWWYRTTLEETRSEAEDPESADAESPVLVLEGLATVAEVYLDGELLLRSESMFARHRAPLGAPRAGTQAARGADHQTGELAICFRALGPLLRVRRRPRARWRTALVSDGNLRFFRTMLIGRAPGFAPGPPVVGPFRPVRVEPARALDGSELVVRAALAGSDGVLEIRVHPAAGPLRVALHGPGAPVQAELPGGGGEIRIPDVTPWWPHTHGAPTLYALAIDTHDGDALQRGRVGFRSLECPSDWEARGFALEVNGVPVFCRGAVWTPGSLEQPHEEEVKLRRTLEALRESGINMLRVAGIGTYEADAFYELCDELGILVWQDFMFANLDYPDADPEFLEVVRCEVRQELRRLAPRPSLAVLCGGSEVAQQVTMLGLDPELARPSLLCEHLPRWIAEAGVEVPYVPNAPWGGDLPFRPGAGVANYYGVGAYLRPLTDARLAGVSFAAEALAFSNVPDEPALEPLEPAGNTVSHHPAWKAGVPRDAGAGWDFEDVRDHYLKELYGLDPVALRSAEPERYLELSRAVSGEVMSEAFGEWRRQGSSCAGALVLWLRDHRPGAGWGLLDHTGAFKPAMHALSRILAPVAVWTTDEGLSGIDVHVANDLEEPLRASLRVTLHRDGETLVGEGSTEIEVAPRTVRRYGVEELLGRFVDVNWSYRFGAPAQDVVAVSLEPPGKGEALSHHVRFPVGRPVRPETVEQLGLQAELEQADGDTPVLHVRARRVVHHVRVLAPGRTPSDSGFSLPPGAERRIRLRADAPEPVPAVVTIRAVNLRGELRVRA